MYLECLKPISSYPEFLHHRNLSDVSKKKSTKNDFIPLAPDFIGLLYNAFDEFYRKAEGVFLPSSTDLGQSGSKHPELSSELQNTTYLVLGDLLQTLAVIIDAAKNSPTISADLGNLMDLISVSLDVPNTPHLRYG